MATRDVAAEPPLAPVTYDVRVHAAQTLRAGAPSRLLLNLVSSAGSAPALVPTYGAYLHVIAVSTDLRWYAHLHPDEEQTADVPLDLTFPRDGDYVLFAYFRPLNGEVEMRRIPVTIGRAVRREETPRLRATGATAKVRGYEVMMTATPQPLRTQRWESFTFRLARNGAPVGTLGSEGTLGHLAIVAEGAQDFVFAHSTIEEAGGVRAGLHVPVHPPLSNGDPHTRLDVGPEVTFHAQFPHPGRYKLWAEFTPGGDDVMAQFVVEVGE